MFSGVAFTTHEDLVKDVYEFSQGNRIGVYQNKYLPDRSDIPHVDIDYIEFMGEYLDGYAFYNNKRFSGIAYELEGEQDFCLGQHWIEDGNAIASCGWYPSGEKESLRLDSDNILQSYEWFKDGSVKKISIYIRECKKTIVNVGFDVSKKIGSLRIEENYFDLIEKYSPQLEHHYFESRSFLDDCAVNSRLSLMSSGVNDSVFDSLALNNGFQDLSLVIISNASLTASSILKLANLENLAEVTFLEDKNDLLSIVKKLKLLRPDCLIKLNHQIIKNTDMD